MTSPAPRHDAIVIGGGSAASAFARGAAGFGARVLLIERGHLGGTCVNRGCVPKKLLWIASRTAGGIADLARVGIAADACAGAIDYAVLHRRIDDELTALRASFAAALAHAGVAVLRGEAEVRDAKTVRVDGVDYACETLVLATGARPTRIAVDGAGLMSVSDDVFAWSTLPSRLLIVGGGYVGCEFAAIYAALGVDVTLVTHGDRVLERFDADAVDVVTRNLRNRGVDLRMNAGLDRVARVEGDALEVGFGDGSIGTWDRVLCATGRKPALDCAIALGDRLEKGANGALAVDDRLCTSVPGVHAIGDVAARIPLTPVATRDGAALASILYGHGGTVADLSTVASTVFVHPEIAQVGAFGQEHPAVGCHVDPLERGVLRAARGCEGEVFQKVSVDAGGRVAGAVLVGDGASEVIAWCAASIGAGLPADALASAVPIHPSYAEELVGSRRLRG